MSNVKEYYSLITNIDIADVARELIGSRVTEESGNVILVDCPVHNSQSKTSFQIDKQKQCWYCFGCGIGGDVLHLVEFIQSGALTKETTGAMPHSHRAARDWLAQKAGLPPLSKYNLPAEQIAEIESRRAEEEMVHSILTDIADFYHKKLVDQIPTLDAFKDQYGISDETITSLKIGYADNNGLLAWLKNERKYSPADLARIGCFTVSSQDNLIPFFDKRFTFPYWKQGKVVYFAARETRWTEKTKFEIGKKYKKLPTRSDLKKYISPCIRNSYFYNEDSLLGDHDYTIIAEGVTDCISLMEHGFPTISPVTKSFRERDHEKLFSLLAKLKRVYICLDNEISGAGLRGALDTAHFLESKGLVVSIIDLPLSEKQGQARKQLQNKFGIHTGLTPKEIAQKQEDIGGQDEETVSRLLKDAKIDINEYFLSKTAADFQNLLLEARAPIEFEIERILPDLPEDIRNKKLQPVLSALSTLKPIEQERYVGIIHSHFNKQLSKKSIQDTIRAIRREDRANNKKKFHSDAPEGSCKRLIDLLTFETTEEEGKINWNKIARGVYQWFRDHGAIFFHDTGNNRFMYFEGDVFRMDTDKINNPAYLSMLYKHTQIPITTSPAGRMFHEQLDYIAYEEGDVKEPHYWLHTNRSKHTVFFNLNNGKNEVLKITPDEITIVRNGINDENIVFHNSPTMMPIEFIPDVDIADAEQLFKSLIFDNLACPIEERVLITTWISCFLLLDFAGTRPLLRFEGVVDSGKSTASKLISALLFGSMDLENPTIAAIYTEGAKQPLIVLDNIELKNATDELIQFLLTAVTGIIRTKRKQGTDTDVIRESVKCLINTSGVEPLAGLSELTTRTILVEFDLSHSSSGYFLEAETIQDVSDARNIILSGIFKKTQAILRMLRDGAHGTIMKLFAEVLGPHPKKRCNDYLSLMYLMLLIGMDEKEMEKFTRTVHPVFKTILDNQRAISEVQEIEANPFITFIVLLVKERLLAIESDENGGAFGSLDNFNRTYGLRFADNFTIVDAQPRDFYSAFSKYAQMKGIRSPYMNAIQLSKRLRNDLKTIERSGIQISQVKNTHTKSTLFTVSVNPSLITSMKKPVEELRFDDDE